MRILAIDPGGTTGIARYQTAEERGGEQFGSFELSTVPALDAIHMMLVSGWGVTGGPDRPWDLLVCELFIIGPGTVKKTRPGSMAALESIGALRWLTHHYDVEFDGQLPGEKEFASNAKLKKLGWRNPTPGGHCDDAARHLLVAAIKRGLIDPAMFI